VSSYFRLDGPLEASIERLLGPDRFAPYLAAAGNRSDALRLYSWNAALAGAFLGPISMVEVSLRNAISGQLQSRFGNAWFDDAAFLGFDATSRTRDNITTAKQRVARARPVRPITESRVVSELYLSFWTHLLRPATNRTLWPLLRPAFTKYTHRKTLVRYLDPLVPFRNRVAHHEPVFSRHPHAVYDGLLSVADMLSPDLRGWIEHHARVRSLLADGPDTAGIKF
jgi:Abi-like protein